jgi:hypothetical protein
VVGDIEAMSVKVSSRRPSALAFAVACCILSTESLAVGQKKFLIFGDKNVSYKIFKDAVGRFELEYPTKDWSPFPTGGSSIAILARNDRTATVVIDLAHLTEPLAPAEVATNAQIEVDSLKEQQPTAKDFKSEILYTNAGRASLIRYTRVGANGPERVIHYSVAIAHDLYRLDAVVQEASLAKHEPIIMHMILSFKVPASSPSSKN